MNELVIAQRLTRRVQALEDLLGVRLCAEGDRDMFQTLQTAPDAWGLVGVHLAAEEGVVVIEPRLPSVVVATIEYDGFVQMSPRVMRTQLRARGVIGSYEHALELGGQLRIAVSNGMMESCHEQHDRGDALLAVDEDQIRLRGILRRKDRADEVTVTRILTGHRSDVGQETLATPDVPAVLALIHRNDDRGAGGGQPLDCAYGVGFDVRGGCHVARFCSSHRRRPAGAP